MEDFKGTYKRTKIQLHELKKSNIDKKANNTTFHVHYKHACVVDVTSKNADW
jgi:hypothetical protein